MVSINVISLHKINLLRPSNYIRAETVVSGNYGLASGFASEFHKTLLKSSLQMHWISVRFMKWAIIKTNFAKICRIIVFPFLMKEERRCVPEQYLLGVLIKSGSGTQKRWIYS